MKGRLLRPVDGSNDAQNASEIFDRLRQGAPFSGSDRIVICDNITASQCGLQATMLY